LSPIGWSGPHTANQIGGDLYPYDTTMMRPARYVICDSPVPDLKKIYSRFIVKCTLHEEMPVDKKIAKIYLRNTYTVVEKNFLHNNCLSFGL
jgi:hypothetical protein